MLGAIIGDISGSIYEWSPNKSKDFELFSGTEKYRPTDDSIMTIAVAEALLESSDDFSNLRDMTIKHMQRLGRKYPHAGYGGRFKQWIFSSNPEPYFSYGNGAAMRVSPCAYAASTIEEAIAFADAVTEVTHNHQEGIRGAEAVVAAVFMALHGADKQEIRDYIEENYYDLDFTLDSIRDEYEFDVTCQGSVPEAIVAFLESTDFEDAIKNAISLGGDADTQAAIAGSIAEAYYGIPEDLREQGLAYLDSSLKETIFKFEERFEEGQSHEESFPDDLETVHSSEQLSLTAFHEEVQPSLTKQDHYESIKNNIRKGTEDAFILDSNYSNLAYKPEFLVNDYANGQKVLTTIERELSNCDEFSISVAFITKGGLLPLLQILQELKKKGVKGRVLTTDYLTFSEPEALDQFASFENIELKIFKSDEGRGFHTKGYIFRNDKVYSIIVGSSNMTQKALTVNQEWNTKLVSTAEGEYAKKICGEFDQLWNDRAAYDYAAYIDEYRQKYETIKIQREIAAQQNPVLFSEYRLEPNSMQVGFINSLKKQVENGADKALLISATGTGKTYASAFGVRDALPYKGKVLFIVHRKQILRQAAEAYANVFGRNRSFALLTGEDQDYRAIKAADFVFAMITMISKEHVMHLFEKDEFSTIVIDEVHHAAAQSYQKVMSYFEPDFWLGMTATPDRTDDGDIYELFDHNIAYEIRLQQALENDLLCPFHYFGIKDIAFDANADADDLIKRAEQGDLTVFNMLTSDERVDYIIEQANYYGYSGTRVKGLIFCSSVREAQKLSECFNDKGLRTLALSGEDNDDTRRQAVERLVKEDAEDALDYILTVNIFNEGVDLPEINQIIMLRPTESAIVFIQQLGRGLRKLSGKEYVVILDFIGNYSNNFLIPIALSGDRTYNKDNMRKYLMEGSSIIPGCSTIHFDEVTKESIFAAIDKSSTPLKFLKEKYFNLRKRLGRMPTAEEFYRYGEIDPELFMKYEKGSYYRFVARCDDESGMPELTEEQNLTLDYICTQIVNGKRPHELIMLKQLIEENRIDKKGVIKRLDHYNIVFRQSDFDSAIRVLDKSFINTQSDKKKYQPVKIIEHTNPAEQIYRCSRYMEMMSWSSARDKAFRAALQDLVQYGLLRYEDLYSEGDDDGLVLYQKYSRRDVCRLLNWDRDEGSIIYGYRIKYNTCPIFVTYEKKEDISETTKYEDEFVNAQLFSWMTRSRVSLNSTEAQEIINYKNSGLKIYLFIKKSDGEGTDFYYMGRVKPTDYRQTTIKDNNGRELPIMNFDMQFEHAVRSDIYDYLTK